MSINSNTPTRCPTCKGRGRWQEVETGYNGTTESLVWKECNDCHGTGVKPDPEAQDVYDIGGDSLDEQD